MIQAEILGPWWVGDVIPGEGGEPDSYPMKPMVLEEYPVEFVGSRPERIAVPYSPDNLLPAPNMCSVVIVYSDAKFAQIEADSKYFINWSEDV